MTMSFCQIDACLAALGTDSFAAIYVEVLHGMGVDQVMVFSIDADRARCLLSRNFTRAAVGGKLAKAYLDGWFRRDPLLNDLMCTPSGVVDLRTFSDFAGRMDTDYRRIFFDDPGLRAKTALLAVGARLRLFVNLYQAASGSPIAPESARLAGRLALLHFESLSKPVMPEPFAVLSEQERRVCMGILSGQKAEAIAGDMGTAVSTAVTYRKRAYEKLGTTSRAGLFAICRA